MGSEDFRMVRPVSIAAGGSITTGGGTYWDSTGALRTAIAGALRVTYDPADLSAPAYPLVEGAATNLALYSDSLAAGAWSFPGAAIGSAPNNKLIPNASGADDYHYALQNVPASIGQTYVLWADIQAAGLTWCALGVTGSTIAFFDLASGLAGLAAGGLTSSIEYKGGGVYRCSIFYTNAALSSLGLYVYAAQGPQHFFMGDGINGINILRVQFELGKATSYIQTTSAAVTRPADIITGPGLAYSSVPEATVTEYASGTTYIDGEIRGVTTGTAQAVYRTRKNGNVGNAPASSPTWWRFLGTVYATYAPGTYALDAIVTDLPNHQLYQSLAASNTAALTDKTKWLPLGATTRWKCFDKAVNSQTTAPELLTMAMVPGSLVNTLTALNVSGSRVTVTQTDSGYKRSKSLVRHDVLNWYDWFYEEPIREGDVVFDDIPPYAQSALTITIENPGDTAGIGCCFVGKSRTIGKTAWELTGGILSYSTTNTDTFGNVTFVKRESAKRLNFEVYVPTGFESEAYRLLKQYTDVEMVFIGASDYSMTIAYGFLGQWAVPISNRGKTAPIEVRGLI